MATKKPAFYIVTTLFLLWNLIGVAAFITDVTAPETFREGMTAAQIELMDQRPAWFMLLYGTAVCTGTLACIFLYLRSKASVVLAFISLGALLINDAYQLIFTDLPSTMDTGGYVFFFVILFLSFALLFYTMRHTGSSALRMKERY